MNHTDFVRVHQGRCDLQRVIDRVGRLEWPTRSDQVPDVGPGDVLESNEMQTPILTHVEDPGNVVMIQTRRSASLVAETLHRSRIQRLEWTQNLQSHRSTQTRVVGSEHSTHPAHTNPLVDDEMIQLHTDRTRQRQHRRTAPGYALDRSTHRRKQSAAQRRSRSRWNRLAQPLLLGTDHRRSTVVHQSTCRWRRHVTRPITRQATRLDG